MYLYRGNNLYRRKNLLQNRFFLVNTKDSNKLSEKQKSFDRYIRCFFLTLKKHEFLFIKHQRQTKLYSVIFMKNFKNLYYKHFARMPLSLQS